MSHPQQPSGQQPGQHGGQQPTGGSQQGGQQYGGYDPTAPHQPPPYGPPGGPYGGGYGPPPPKRNTGVIVAITAVVVLLLGAFGVTGFVAPGFLLGDDESSVDAGDDLPPGSPGAPTDPTDASAPATDTASPKGDDDFGNGPQVVREFLESVNGGDSTTAKSMLCSDSTSQRDVDAAVRGGANLTVKTADMEDTGDYVGVDLKGTIDGARSYAARISAFLEANGWCVYSFYAF